MSKVDIARSLSEIPLLVSLPFSVIERLSTKFTELDLPANQTLFHKGDVGASMYIVASGAVNVIIEDPHGRELVLTKTTPGGSIGEISLVDQEPRAASAVAAEDTKLYMLDREDFLAILSEYPADMLESIRDVSAYLRFGYTIETLKSLDLFKGVPEEILIELSSKMTRITLGKDDTLFEKGDPGDALYVVNSGWVKIVTEDNLGEELVLNQCGIGEAIGDMALLDDQARSASVIALSDVEMLKLDRDIFLEILAQQPALSMHMLRSLTNRLRFNTTYIEEAIEITRQVADGDYSFAMTQIQQTQGKIVGDQASDETRANEMLASFFAMIKGVQEREENLKIQLRQLTIQIDQVKRQDEVDKLTASPFFADLKAAADQAREERADED